MKKLLITFLFPLAVFGQGAPTIRFNTVADMVAKAIPTVNNSLTALVAGRVAANDGGGGVFFFVAGSAAITNTSAIFPSTGVAGRWFRVAGNYTDSLWFPTETNKYIRLPQTGQLQIGVNLGYINVSSNYPRTFQWQGFNDGQSKGIHIPDWGSGVAVGEPTAEFVVWGKGSLDAVTAGQPSEALVIDSVKETSYRIKTSVGGTAGVNRPLIFLQENTEAMKMDTSARIEIKSHLTVGSTNAGPQMFNVLGGRSQLSSAGNAFALALAYSTTAGSFILGASDSATPSLIFSDGAGTERARMLNTGLFQANYGVSTPTVVATNSLTTPMVIGGTDVTSGLTLKSTTATGTTDNIRLMVGNNGDTAGIIITNTGSVTIGSTTLGGQKFNVVGGRSALAAASEPFSLGVQYNISSGAFYLGASNSATPDGLLSNGAGTELWRITYTGDFQGSVAGKGLQIKEGSNARMGVSVLNGGSPASVVVNNTSVTANTRIFLTGNADGGTVGFVRVSARTAATSFTITSSANGDTSTVAWLLVEPSP